MNTSPGVKDGIRHMPPLLDFEWFGPWKNLPRTILFYAIAWFIGAIILTILTILIAKI